MASAESRQDPAPGRPAPSVSVIVITFNEERNIERCLGSLRWAGEIIVVDSFSSDPTVDLARKYTSRIIQHAYDGDIRQRERGFGAATGDWLMYVDADEEVSPGLAAEILSAVASGNPIDGYFVPRKVFALGRWIEHGGWSPDHSFRLFRRGSYLPHYAEVHGGFSVSGATGQLSAPLYHYTYDSISQYLSKMNDYTSLQVSARIGERMSPAGRLAKLVFSPVSHFIRKYVSNRGYKDGMPGFLLAALGSVYTLALYAKLWEYDYRGREGAGQLPPVTNVELQKLRRA